MGPLAKVAIVGVGMRSHAGVATQLFESLARQGVKALLISTSEIKIAVLIPESALEKANAELRRTLMALRPGETTAPLHTAEGYRILKLITREPAGLLFGKAVHPSGRGGIDATTKQHHAFVRIAGGG